MNGKSLMGAVICLVVMGLIGNLVSSATAQMGPGQPSFCDTATPPASPHGY